MNTALSDRDEVRRPLGFGLQPSTQIHGWDRQRQMVRPSALSVARTALSTDHRAVCRLSPLTRPAESSRPVPLTSEAASWIPVLRF